MTIVQGRTVRLNLGESCRKRGRVREKAYCSKDKASRGGIIDAKDPSSQSGARWVCYCCCDLDGSVKMTKIIRPTCRDSSAGEAGAYGKWVVELVGYRRIEREGDARMFN